MSGTMSAPAAGVADVGSADGAATARAVAWHNLSSDDVCARLGVDPQQGLDTAEVAKRRAEVGLNKLAEGKPEPGWHAFLRQYRDLMQLVLLGAAIVSMTKGWPSVAGPRSSKRTRSLAAASSRK